VLAANIDDRQAIGQIAVHGAQQPRDYRGDFVYSFSLSSASASRSRS
jgi:hypothetical protein